MSMAFFSMLAFWKTDTGLHWDEAHKAVKTIDLDWLENEMDDSLYEQYFFGLDGVDDEGNYTEGTVTLVQETLENAIDNLQDIIDTQAVSVWTNVLGGVDILIMGYDSWGDSDPDMDDLQLIYEIKPVREAIGFLNLENPICYT